MTSPPCRISIPPSCASAAGAATREAEFTEFVQAASGSLLRAALVLLERALPKHKKYLPSATGVGLGMLLPFYQSLAMFLGALVGAVLVLRVHIAYPLVIALVILAVVAVTAVASATHPHTAS